MMQFLITAYDGTDENALERRMAVRGAHLENMARVREHADVISAGGILNDGGQMIGSFLVMDFADRAALDSYLASEPYILGKVWQDVRVERCNAVIVNNEKVGS